jgi:hypothetical protein
MTDLFLKAHQAKPFSWGATNLTGMSKVREAYIQALRAADKHDYQHLDPGQPTRILLTFDTKEKLGG